MNCKRSEKKQNIYKEILHSLWKFVSVCNLFINQAHITETLKTIFDKKKL